MEDRPGDAERSSPEARLDAVDYGARFQRHRETLQLHMEYIFGFNNLIEGKDIFSYQEFSRIENERDQFELNSMMLELLIKKNKVIYFEEFLDVLGESWQTHLRRLILQNGKFSEKELDQPLTKSQLKHLRTNKGKIVDNLHSLVDEVPNRLLENGCINQYHLQKILHNVSSTNLERARTMMSIMENRSLLHFNIFRGILKKRKSPVHEFLNFEKSACIVTLDTNNAISRNLVPQTPSFSGAGNRVVLNAENALNSRDIMPNRHDVSNVMDLSNVHDISNREMISDDMYVSPAENVTYGDNFSNVGDSFTAPNASHNVLRHTIELKELVEKQIVVNFSKSSPIFNIACAIDAQVIAITNGKSIRVYIRCPTRDSLVKLRESVGNGSMKSSLEKLYNDLLPKNQQLSLKVTKVFMVDFKMQEFYQHCDVNNVDVTDNMLGHELLRNGKSNMSNVLLTNENELMSTGLIKRILLKAYYLRLAEFIESSSQVGSQPDSAVINVLSSVCRVWWKTLKLCRFKKTIHAKSTKTFKRKKKISRDHFNMAESILLNNQKDSKKEITDCGICNKTVDDPRMLDCFHTFCLKCLKGFGTGKSGGDNINCPVCKREFKIPSDGFDDVPVNGFVRKLIRVDKYPDQEELGVDLAKSFCEECLIVEQKEPAAGYCVDCGEHMCNTCIRKHNKNKVFLTHKMFGLDKKPRGDELLKMTANNCQDHPSNPIEAFCSECKTTLCVTGMHTGDHKEHNCMDIKKAAVELSKSTDVDAAEWSKYMQETGDIIKLCHSTLEDLEGQIESARSGVKKRYEEIKVLLEENYNELNETLGQIKGKRKGELERMRDEGKQEMLMLESFERHWNEVKARGSDCDVVQAAISLQKRREEVVKQHEQMRTAKENNIVKKSHHLHYVATDSFTIGRGKSLLGVINETSTEHMPCNGWNRFLDSCNVQRFALEENRLSGVAIFNNEVFLTNSGTPHILVYSLQNLSTVSRKISVPGLTSARGLVYNESDSCLYASNDIPGHIHKIRIRDESVTGWVTQTGLPWGLSISKQKNLLISYYNCGQIDEFNGSGQLIRSIKFSDGITGICHSIELETGEFIICQSDPLPRICLVDSSGKVIKSYGKERGSGVGQLNCPVQVELDQRGNILVIYSYNHKLTVLTSDLKYVADVCITNTQFAGPSSFCWDNVNDRLLIVTWSRGVYVITPQSS